MDSSVLDPTAGDSGRVEPVPIIKWRGWPEADCRSAATLRHQVENFASTVSRNLARRSGFVWFMS
jgi:hypothetical protein